MKFQPARLFEEDTGLESDLEWMLQSGQIPVDILVPELIRAHFQDLYTWLLLVLDDPELAAFASLEAILAASINAYRFPAGISSQVWVFRQAAGLSRRLLRRRRWRGAWIGLASLFGRDVPAASYPATRLDAAFWLAFDQLSGDSQLAAGLSWGLGLEPEGIAQILERSKAEIAEQLQLARRRILDGLPLFELSLSDLPDQELDLSLTQSLERRLAQLQTGPLDLEALIEAAAQEAGRQTSRQSLWARLKEIIWLGGIVALILGFFWVVNLVRPEPEPGSPASQTPQSNALPSPPSGALPSPPSGALPIPPSGALPIPPPGALHSPASLPPDEILLLDYYPQAGETLAEIGALLNLTGGEIERLVAEYPDGILDFSEPLRIELSAPVQQPMPTVVPPVAHRQAPLTVNSSPDEIRTLMKLSPTLWHTLWLDSVTFDYGPDGYYGSPHLYRVQSWISQPDQSLTITWISSSDHTYANLKRSGLSFTNYQHGNIEVRRVDSSSPSQGLAMDMIFPNQSQIFTRPGQMQVLGKDTIAGRSAIVVDWRTEEIAFWPNRYRMWVDTQTGIVLRFQLFFDQQGETLLAEVIIVRLDLDVDFPQAGLFTPWRLREQVFASNYRGGLAAASVLPVMNAPPEDRGWIQERIAPPPGFDPSASRLRFQYEAGLQPSTQASPVAVFADQYYLGEIMLTDPWGVHCVRSPDGRKVAFSFNPYGGPQVGTGWFELNAPLQVKTTNLGQRFGRFAFSPDSLQLAIFAKEQATLTGTLFVIDTETGQERGLVRLENAKNLVWSQDGSRIALLAGNPDWSRVTARLFDAVSGEQLEMAEVISDLIWDAGLRSPDWPLPGSPVVDWEMTFPSLDQGLSACINPPP